VIRTRLRPTPTPDELAALYPVPHQHTRWPDHILRVQVTTTLAQAMVPVGGLVADLSAGDAATARALAESHGCRLLLGDLAPGYPVTGPIETTILDLDERPDLFLCTETLEHLDDPGSVLAEIAKRADRLLISTPLGEADDSNPEHVWGWDAAGVRDLLTTAGWAPALYAELDLRPAGFVYAYQMWGCRQPGTPA
jgi:hypothetical protein